MAMRTRVMYHWAEIQMDAIIAGVRRGLPYEAGGNGRALRYVSEVLHRDRYYAHMPRPHYNSTDAKKLNPLISRRAAALVGIMPFEKFKTKELTRLDHSLPLRQVYEYLEHFHLADGYLDQICFVNCLHAGTHRWPSFSCAASRSVRDTYLRERQRAGRGLRLRAWPAARLADQRRQRPQRAFLVPSDAPN